MLHDQVACVDSPSIGQTLYHRAKTLMPGGTQLLSKRPEMFAPGRWPPYYRQAQGCRVTDLDGRTYIDMSLMGVGSCLLGYADPDVTEAVVARVREGSMCTLNSAEEIELAELLLSLHPWAQQVRYARTGGEAMAMAARVARAATGRDIIAFCGYHGWHDWYLAANLGDADDKVDQLASHLLTGLEPAGVPRQLTGTAVPFSYNRLDELHTIVQSRGGRLAAVIMEPTRAVAPSPGFLEGVRQLCDACGAMLVLDEITAGWRFAFGGAHLVYGIEPDAAVFAKALGNGHPIAALVGRKRMMEAMERSFISSTYWTEGVGPVAALATLRKMQTVDLPAHIRGIGERFRHQIAALAHRHLVNVSFAGHAALTSMRFDHPDHAALLTLWTARMLERGFLVSGSFYPSLAHGEAEVDACVAAADAVFAELSQAARDGDAAHRLGTPVKHEGFRRLA